MHDEDESFNHVCEGTLVKPSKADRKFSKKLNKKILNLLKEYGDRIHVSEEPTNHLFIGNGGMLCNVSREDILSVFSKFGLITELIMIPQKSFSLISYKTVEASRNAAMVLHGFIFQDTCSRAPLYLKYLSTEVQKLNMSSNVAYPSEKKPQLVNGLVLKENFISEDYEKKLIDYFNAAFQKASLTKKSLKHRNVVHYGYEFQYGSNDIDQSKPLEQKIPDICKPLLEQMQSETYIDFVPDQLTVNQYLQGQGIPPHVDTHSAFEDGIISISLNSNVCMDFAHPDGCTVPLILPRRSLLVMKGEARYLWTHGITPRKYDVVLTNDAISDQNNKKEEEEHLTLRKRDMRISLTFRRLLHEPCKCAYPDKCDSQLRSTLESVLHVPITSSEARTLEGEHVNDVYEEIACHFSSTRHSPWPHVKEFLNSLPNGSLVADVGCGNGKYLGVNMELFTFGSDRSFNLAKICRQRGFQVLVADCLKTPYRTNCFDASICIAVIHHLSTEKRRLEALQELVRITRLGGLILVYVWALEQNYDNVGQETMEIVCDSIHKERMKKHEGSETFEEENYKQTIEISEGRYQFQQQDLLVPWHLKSSSQSKEYQNAKTDRKVNETGKIYHRFYHVFKRGELENLCLQIKQINIEKIYFDCGNWCAILKKV